MTVSKSAALFESVSQCATYFSLFFFFLGRNSRLSSIVKVGDALVMVGGFEVSSVWKGRSHGHSTDEDAIHALLDRAPRPTILKLRSQEQISSGSTDQKALTGTLIKSRTIQLCNESRAQGTYCSPVSG